MNHRPTEPIGLDCVRHVTVAKPQHLEALALANRRRRDGAAWRRRTKQLPYPLALKRLAEALEPKAIPLSVASMKLDYFLRSVNRFGPRASASLCAAIGAPGAIRVGELNVGERARLAGILRERATAYEELAA